MEYTNKGTSIISRKQPRKGGGIFSNKNHIGNSWRKGKAIINTLEVRYWI